MHCMLSQMSENTVFMIMVLLNALDSVQISDYNIGNPSTT